MSFEVELKFPVSNFQQLKTQMETLPVETHAPIRQVDRYFNHPARDFGETNEALRIRTIGDETRITYKGPLLDEVAKTRREIELQLNDKAEDQLAEMLTLLGFREVRTVAKTRTCASVEFENRPVEIAMDEVDGRGEFVELETVTDDADRESARDSLLKLADQLSLAESTRVSYLEMLLQKDSK